MTPRQIAFIERQKWREHNERSERYDVLLVLAVFPVTLWAYILGTIAGILYL